MTTNCGTGRHAAGRRPLLDAAYAGAVRRPRGGGDDWIESGFADLKHLRAVPSSVNRQPAVAFYLWREGEGAYLPLTIDVLRVTGGAITEIVTFHDDQLPRLGLPELLPADGTE